jgi:hypothetical protein
VLGTMNLSYLPSTTLSARSLPLGSVRSVQSELTSTLACFASPSVTTATLGIPSLVIV